MRTHIACAVICSLLMCVFAASAEPVAFKDASLKTVVEEELGVADPSASDMLQLTSLNADGRAIVDLAGL